MEPKTEPNEQSELQIPFFPENKYKMQKTFPSPSSRKSHMVTCAIRTEKRYQSKKNNKKRYRKASENELQALVISQTHPVVTLETLDTTQTDSVVSNTLQTDPVLSNSNQETSNESSTSDSKPKKKRNSYSIQEKANTILRFQQAQVEDENLSMSVFAEFQARITKSMLCDWLKRKDKILKLAYEGCNLKKGMSKM